MPPSPSPLPEEFAAALDANPNARALFDNLPESHKQEYLRWISEAKKQQTRISRSEKAVEMLQKKSNSPS